MLLKAYSSFGGEHGVEQHLRAASGPAHVLLLLHPPVHQLVHSRLHARRRYAMAFAIFPAVVDQSGLVCGQVRPQFGQPLANLFDRRLAGIRFRSHYVNIDSVVKTTKSDAGSVQVAKFSTSRDSSDASVSTAGARILDMRKIDEAFSDSLKTPRNVIPIQDVLLVSVEQFAHQRPHAVLAIRDDPQLGLDASSTLP